MRWWSLPVGRIRGIRIDLHITFLAFVAFLCWQGFSTNGATGAFAAFVAIGIVFSSVLLHELGHCIVAQKHRIEVPRVVLLPIGGMAQFAVVPREPRAELLITLAGPAVNFVLAALLFALLMPFNDSPFAWLTGLPVTLDLSTMLLLGLQINLAMGLFNLIPVFPMDGGRILRSALAHRIGFLTSTRIAVYLGKALAIVGIFSALMLTKESDYLLAALFAFIFIAGEFEYQATKSTELYSNLAVADLVEASPPDTPNDDAALPATQLRNHQYTPAEIADLPRLQASWPAQIFAQIFAKSEKQRVYAVFDGVRFIGLFSVESVNDTLQRAYKRKVRAKKLEAIHRANQQRFDLK